MNKAEFDKFADEYRALHASNVRVSGESPEYFAEYKVLDVLRAVQQSGVSVSTILDFGAGIGGSVDYFRKAFPDARLICTDVSEKSLQLGSARHAGLAEFRLFDGKSLPFPNESFDLAFVACVFHHIDPVEHVALISELRRVLRRGGLVAVFEHNPFNPITVHAVNTCPFDENARLISPWVMRARVKEAGFPDPRLCFRLFFPGPLRRFRPAEKFLRWCPLGAQYSVMATK